ncbi:maleylpyruvate isomerase family mycothiol-dependent enzyme [Streptomyces sp. WAC07149]|uniref:maleylpyruvate isomerase family mycothiol-dependent enzyme n=1 Tax=Streptomyces sp. WAC07149 TaxID=2487425 RepID=UPI000F791F84|nr:maleylpyruvate isomerase family mycothiol-dependent enzyme [Streptomyces sp. WAC07149]RSS99061.1 maleylpyruvate isomerase family mycothiol-dependent enzyme [Streptomyces sp. WAC07149]
MQNTLEFTDLLRLIDERSTAFRAVVASAPDLDVQVPSCPEWKLFDLVRHLGGGDRFWAAIVGAGPADGPPAEAAAARAALVLPREREALVAWLDESTRQLLDALREAGPDAGCWAWWEDVQSPLTAGTVARHRAQESAVHTYDARLALGEPRPLPDEVALDGVEEFLTTCVATASPWPHKPAAIDFRSTEGPVWRLTLDGSGARVARLPLAADTAAEAAALGTASELILFLYNRITADSLRIDGDAVLFDQLRDWDPHA